ncbi:copper chaperone PCu(A)C [Candidatus Odyssella acanthamoebae]|uniref:copper chaperone PCu(A)C n=1 Tax=Candidatus Odyssella acanthamoebae TaxID=91604 RepID=UPI00068E4F0E|nr:copper chaperone PCu(A)C [Candidatus Paracaedibacter acanthamoebae]
MKAKFLLTILFLTTTGAMADCCPESTSQNIHIEQPLVRPALAGKNTGAYMTIKLKCMKATDTLLSAECSACETVELHDHINDNGIMRMRPVANIIVKDGEVNFKPGGLHVMLMGLKHELKEGEILKIRLNFEKAGPIDIDYTVQNPVA